VRSPRNAFLSLFSLVAIIGWLSNANLALADPSTAPAKEDAHSAAGTASNASKAADAQVPQVVAGSKEAALQQALTNADQMDGLMKAGKKAEVVALAKKTLAAIDDYLLSKFGEAEMTAGLPPDIVAAMKKKNAEPLCVFLKKESEADTSLGNLASLTNIRINLKRIITASAAMPAKSN